MLASRSLAHVLLCAVLLWQGAAGALVSGRLAAVATTPAGAICRPGGMLNARPASSRDDRTSRDEALCALQCAALPVAAPPLAPQLAAPDRIFFSRAEIPAPSPSSSAPRLALPPARGPPDVS